jgi:hypothetical protein
MRAKVRTAETKLSTERTLDKLRRIQHQQIILNKTQPITGLSTITQERNAILATLKVKTPPSTRLGCLRQLHVFFLRRLTTSFVATSG